MAGSKQCSKPEGLTLGTSYAIFLVNRAKGKFSPKKVIGTFYALKLRGEW